MVSLLKMMGCESPTRESCSESESVGGGERGERTVSLLNIVKLAHGLNVSVPQARRDDSLIPSDVLG